MHFRQDVFRESLGNLKQIGSTAGLLDPLFLGLGDLPNMAVHGILNETSLALLMKNMP